MTSVAFRRVEVGGAVLDVRCDDGVITHVGDVGSLPAADTGIDGDGAALLPGLHDHHLHLLSLAASRNSIDVAHITSSEEFDRAVRNATAGRWRRIVGYHEAIHGPLDRARLDELVPRAPVRVQHRTGAMWVLNSVGLDAIDLGGHPDGRLFGADTLLRERLPNDALDLKSVGRELRSYGVTSVTDLTPTEDAGTLDLLAQLAVAADFPLHVTVTGGPHLPADAGAALPRGPVKIVLADHDLPPLDSVVDDFRVARAAGRNVAVHCVTRIAVVLALTAWQEVGVEPGDRIEHGAVIPFEMITDLRRVGLVVVTQPAFVRVRGDQYLADVDADEVDDLWRCGALIDQGVGVAGSTDAPFGPANPWQAIATAADRRTSTGRVLGASERIAPARALQMFMTTAADPAGLPRRVGVGEPAELCLLDRPLAAALGDPSSVEVLGTLGRAGPSWTT